MYFYIRAFTADAANQTSQLKRRQSDDLEMFHSARDLHLAEQRASLRLYLLYFKDMELKPQPESLFCRFIENFFLLPGP